MTKQLLILLLAFAQLTPTDAFAKCPNRAISFDGVMRCEVERFGKIERLTFKWDMNPCSNKERLLWSTDGSFESRAYEYKYIAGELLIDTTTDHRNLRVYLRTTTPPLIGYYLDLYDHPVSFSASGNQGFVANQILGGGAVTHELVSGQCELLRGKDWTTKLLNPPYRE